jgi:hypothetical protein
VKRTNSGFTEGYSKGDKDNWAGYDTNNDMETINRSIYLEFINS